MPLNEKSIDYLEQHIPELAVAAITQAYWGALAAGFNVIEYEDGFLIEVHPDGTKKRLRAVEPSTPVIPGTRMNFEK